MVPHNSYRALIILGVIVASVGVYFYVATVLLPSQKTPSPMVPIHIPKYSSIPPGNWHNFTDLSSPTFPYPFNFTIMIGFNNTIEWINDDSIAHTVTSLQIPPDAPTFNSGLIEPGKTFTLSLTVPGVYKYTCMWHNWLAGVITVKPA